MEQETIIIGKESRIVIPAKAGIQTLSFRYAKSWIPAFAGMTSIIANDPLL